MKCQAFEGFYKGMMTPQSRSAKPRSLWWKLSNSNNPPALMTSIFSSNFVWHSLRLSFVTAEDPKPWHLLEFELFLSAPEGPSSCSNSPNVHLRAETAKNTLPLCLKFGNTEANSWDVICQDSSITCSSIKSRRVPTLRQHKLKSISAWTTYSAFWVSYGVIHVALTASTGVYHEAKKIAKSSTWYILKCAMWTCLKQSKPRCICINIHKLTNFGRSAAGRALLVITALSGPAVVSLRTPWIQQPETLSVWIGCAMARHWFDTSNVARCAWCQPTGWSQACSHGNMNCSTYGLEKKCTSVAVFIFLVFLYLTNLPTYLAKL